MKDRGIEDAGTVLRTDPAIAPKPMLVVPGAPLLGRLNAAAACELHVSKQPSTCLHTWLQTSLAQGRCPSQLRRARGMPVWQQ